MTFYHGKTYYPLTKTKTITSTHCIICLEYIWPGSSWLGGSYMTLESGREETVFRCYECGLQICETCAFSVHKKVWTYKKYSITFKNFMADFEHFSVLINALWIVLQIFIQKMYKIKTYGNI